MAWITLGVVQPIVEDWTIIPTTFPSELNFFRLNYSTTLNDEIESNGWMRYYYPDEDLYSETWIKFYRKNNQDEFFIDPPRNYIPDTFRRVELKKQLFRSGSRTLRTPLDWSVRVDVWDERIAISEPVFLEEEAISEVATAVTTEIINNSGQLAEQIADSFTEEVNENRRRQIVNFFGGLFN